MTNVTAAPGYGWSHPLTSAWSLSLVNSRVLIPRAEETVDSTVDLPPSFSLHVRRPSPNNVIIYYNSVLASPIYHSPVIYVIVIILNYNLQ